MTITDAAALNFSVAPQDAGQIVEVGYCQIDGVIVRRTLDRSDGSATYSIADWSDVWDALKDGSDEARHIESWCIANGPPPISDQCWRDL